MNTARKKRRYSPVGVGPSGPPWPDGLFVGSLRNPEYATRFAAILSQFEHLEAAMPRILTILLGMTDAKPAGYVYRALRNPNIRSDVMRTLLEKAPHNAQLGDEFDDLLTEYEAVRSGRNGYAHGLWYTHEKSKAVFLARRDEHGWGLLQAQPEPIEALDNLLKRIGDLLTTIHRVDAKVRPRKQLRVGNPPQSATPRKVKRRRPRSESK
jgi:hypothetical protein